LREPLVRVVRNSEARTLLKDVKNC
jgi:hypothetical protein